MRTTKIHCAGMCCPSEEPLIRKQLGSFGASVREVRFDHLTKRISVVHDLEAPQPLVQALNQVGMQASLVELQPVLRQSWITPRIAVALATAGACEGLTWVIGESSGPIAASLFVVVLLLVGWEPWKRCWQGLVSLQFTIHVLMGLAVAGAAGLGQWPEAAMVLALFRWSERLEAYSLFRVHLALQELLDSAPETAEVEEDGNWVRRSVADIHAGQRVRLKPGDRVALDGRLREGSSSLNQAALTGESLPVEKGPGDPILAGSINQEGSFVMEVTASLGDRQLDRIAAAVQRAQQEKAPSQRFIDRFSAVYTPLVLAGALLLALLPTLLGWPEAQAWFYRALVLLVIACPCAMVLATPVTLVSGLAAAARLGVLVKGATAMEEGARIRLVAFDKTGTLTLGQPSLAQTHWWEGDRLRELASLQEPSSHPLAGAVRRAWGGQGPLLPVSDWSQVTGKGLVGSLEGVPWSVLSHRWLEEAGHCRSELHQLLHDWEGQGHTTAVLLREDRPLGAMGFSDPARQEAARALKELSRLGIETVLITGDQPQAAQTIAAQLGLSRFFANQSPEDKLTRIQELTQQGKHVAMVGDGINDAPALARAHLGIAMGRGGTATASEVAEVVLMGDDLCKIPQFFQLARRVRRRLQWNLGLALVSKLAFLGLAVAGKATLWMAVVADVGTSLVVILNGLRLLR